MDMFAFHYHDAHNRALFYRLGNAVAMMPTLRTFTTGRLVECSASSGDG